MAQTDLIKDTYDVCWRLRCWFRLARLTIICAGYVGPMVLMCHPFWSYFNLAEILFRAS